MAFDISSEMMGVATACYRGYFCKYDCTKDNLFLVELAVIGRDNLELPLIEGVSAKTDGIRFFHTYENLRIPCPLSGGLVLVRNPVGLVGHFPSPIEFEEVVEILFEQGLLQMEINHSKKVAELRKTVDELAENLESNNELSEVLTKWDSPLEKVSDPEMMMFEEYINKVVDKSIVLQWSFVSDYEQQPSTSKNTH